MQQHSRHASRAEKNSRKSTPPQMLKSPQSFFRHNDLSDSEDSDSSDDSNDSNDLNYPNDSNERIRLTNPSGANYVEMKKTRGSIKKKSPLRKLPKSIGKTSGKQICFKPKRALTSNLHERSSLVPDAYTLNDSRRRFWDYSRLSQLTAEPGEKRSRLQEVSENPLSSAQLTPRKTNFVNDTGYAGAWRKSQPYSSLDLTLVASSTSQSMVASSFPTSFDRRISNTRILQSPIQSCTCTPRSVSSEQSLFGKNTNRSRQQQYLREYGTNTETDHLNPSGTQMILAKPEISAYTRNLVHFNVERDKYRNIKPDHYYEFGNSKVLNYQSEESPRNGKYHAAQPAFYYQPNTLNAPKFVKSIATQMYQQESKDERKYARSHSNERTIADADVKLDVKRSQNKRTIIMGQSMHKSPTKPNRNRSGIDTKGKAIKKRATVKSFSQNAVLPDENMQRSKFTQQHCKKSDRKKIGDTETYTTHSVGGFKSTKRVSLSHSKPLGQPATSRHGQTVHPNAIPLDIIPEQNQRRVFDIERLARLAQPKERREKYSTLNCCMPSMKWKREESRPAALVAATPRDLVCLIPATDRRKKHICVSVYHSISKQSLPCSKNENLKYAYPTMEFMEHETTRPTTAMSFFSSASQLSGFENDRIEYNLTPLQPIDRATSKSECDDNSSDESDASTVRPARSANSLAQEPSVLMTEFLFPRRLCSASQSSQQHASWTCLRKVSVSESRNLFPRSDSCILPKDHQPIATTSDGPCERRTSRVIDAKRIERLAQPKQRREKYIRPPQESKTYDEEYALMMLRKRSRSLPDPLRIARLAQPKMLAKKYEDKLRRSQSAERRVNDLLVHRSASMVRRRRLHIDALARPRMPRVPQVRRKQSPRRKTASLDLIGASMMTVIGPTGMQSEGCRSGVSIVF